MQAGEATSPTGDDCAGDYDHIVVAGNMATARVATTIPRMRPLVDP